MSSSSTDTCSVSNEQRVIYNVGNSKTYVKIPNLLMSGGSTSSNTEAISNDFASNNYVPSVETIVKPRVISPQCPSMVTFSNSKSISNGENSRIPPTRITLSPLLGYVGPTATDPAHMLPSTMTEKDRERRAALLADSPELPSKPHFQR